LVLALAEDQAVKVPEDALVLAAAWDIMNALAKEIDFTDH